MYHIATSRGVILDTYCIPVSILNHKKKLVIVQMWHAMGALKKFGYSIIDKEEGTSKDIAHVFDMHKNYSYVLTSSHFTKPFFAEAFNININKVKVIPLPRVELLRNDEYINIRKRKLEAKYPELRQKKTIVYAPTFRKECKRKHIKITDHIDTEKYNLIVKDHPLSKRLHSDDRTLKFDEDSLDALIVSDYVITDYSAIIFEASILRKPLFFYTYDYEDYLVKRGFYIDYEKEMPGLISPDINEIMKAIENNNYNLERIINFRDRYVDLSSSNFTKDIVSLILR
jgi:CDP-ribitol ribitolphosphotransferase